MTSRLLVRAGSAAVSAALALTLSAAPSAAAPATSSASAASVVEVEVAKAEAKRVNVRPGLYNGRFRTSTGKQLESFRFRVTKDRKVRQFRAALDVICSYGGAPEVETVGFVFPTTQVKNSGYFKRRWKPNNDSNILLRGRIKNGRLVSGFLDYSVGVCVREADLKAKRVRG